MCEIRVLSVERRAAMCRGVQIPTRTDRRANLSASLTDSMNSCTVCVSSVSDTRHTNALPSVCISAEMTYRERQSVEENHRESYRL